MPKLHLRARLRVKLSGANCMLWYCRALRALRRRVLLCRRKCSPNCLSLGIFKLTWRVKPR